jgi:hypothetical protein
MAERGTPDFYREQAERLTYLAASAHEPATRLELLEIAATFRKLADHVAGKSEPPDSTPDNSTVDAA